MTRTTRLPNGITIVCDTRPGSGLVAMTVGFGGGSTATGHAKPGLANLIEEVVWTGSRTRTQAQIAKAIESRGGSLESATTRDYTLFTVQTLARNAKHSFGILAETVCDPLLDGAEIEKTKARIADRIDQKNQNPGKKVNDVLYLAAYGGDSGLAQPVTGTKSDLNTLTRDDVRGEHSRMLNNPGNMVVSFSGDITMDAAAKMVAQHFGHLKSQPAKPFTPPRFTGGDTRESNDNQQLNLAIAFDAPGQNDPRHYTYMMLRELLSGGMSSPLFQEIREKRGLVYSVNASYRPHLAGGLFAISAGTGRGNAGELIPVAIRLLGDIARDGFTDKQMNTARERILRGIDGDLEKSKDAAQEMADHVLRYGRPIGKGEIEAHLSHVTNDDIRAAAGALLKDGKYALAGIGPQDTMPAQDAIRTMMTDQIKGLSVPKFSAAPSATLTQRFTAGASASAQTTAAPRVTTLKNGMVVVTQERAGPVSCGAWVGAGSDHETPKLNGATHMNEHMMFKGTPSFGPGAIDRIVEGEMGADLNAYTNNDMTAYYFYNLLPRDIEKTVDICGEMVFRANLDHAEFDGHVTTNADGTTSKAKGERDVVIEEIKRADDNISNVVWHALNAQAYPGQTRGRPILGTEQTIRAMTVKMLADYRDEYYVPNNVVFSAAGPVRHEDFVAIVERKFGAMPSRAIAPLPTPTFHGGTTIIENDTAETCDMIVAMEGVSNTHPDRAAYEALGNIMGGGASSRLNRALVDTAVTSYAYMILNDYRNCGQMLFGTSAEAVKAKIVTRTMYDTLRTLGKTLTQSELDTAKARMEMTLRSDLEQNRAMCDRLGIQALSGGAVQSIAEQTAKIRALTLDDIRRVAARLLQSPPAMAMVVPTGTDRALLPAQNDLLAMRDGADTAKPAHKRAGPGPSKTPAP